MLKAVKKAKAQVKDEWINVVTNSRSTFKRESTAIGQQ